MKGLIPDSSKGYGQGYCDDSLYLFSGRRDFMSAYGKEQVIKKPK
jgi:hypothetical protein